VLRCDRQVLCVAKDLKTFLFLLSFVRDFVMAMQK
jgi:hypothetical protein